MIRISGHLTLLLTSALVVALVGVRPSIASLGVSKTALMRLKLRDKQEVSGYIESLDANSVVITNPATGQSETIAYADIVSVKVQRPRATTARAHGLSTRARILIVGAVLGGLIIVIAIFTPK
jgi:hypothetical protein